MPTISTAERCRRHREEMTLALELQITPREARAELDRRAASERWKLTEQRLAAKMNPAPALRAIHGAPTDARQPWWRD